MNKEKSFTLIELLVVIVIIGILAGVIMISTSSSIDKANIAKSKVFEESVANNLAANMISRWRLDGNTNDSWGSNNGINSGVTFSNESICISKECGYFDGADYINFNNNNTLNIRGDITINFWVNPLYGFENVAAFILGNGSSSHYGYHVWLWEAGRIEYRTNQEGAQQGTITLNSEISQNTWSYVVITRHGTNATIYINGIDRTSTHASHIDPDSSVANTLCGNYTTTSTYRLKGSLDDIRLYNDVLSSSKIKQNYIAGLDSLLSKNLILKEDHDERIEKLGVK